MGDNGAYHAHKSNVGGSLNTAEQDLQRADLEAGSSKSSTTSSSNEWRQASASLSGGDDGSLPGAEEEVTTFNFFSNKSHIAVVATGFVLAFDYSVIIISLQSAWHIVRPQHASLYGLVFGLYDLAQFLFMPVMSALSDNVGIKPTLILAILLNIAGNIIYAFVMFAGGHHGEDSEGEEIVGTWYLIIIGRFVAGIGSSAMGLSMIYFTITSKITERTAAISTYRSIQVIARVGAPFLSFAILGLTELGSDTQLLWNFYTIPTWIAAMLGFVALVLVVVFFKEPKRRDIKKVHVWDIDLSKAPNLIYHTVTVYIIHLLMTICCITTYSQLFAFAVGEYHIVPYATRLWLLYIGFGPADLAARFFVKKLHANGWTDKEFILAGLTLMLVAYLLLPSYSTLPPQELFYAGTAILGFSFMFYFPNMESFFTKKITVYEHEAQGNLGFFTSMMPSAGSLGRFVGPFFGGLILQLHQSDYAILYEYCPNFDSERAQSDKSYIRNCYHNVTQAPGGKDTCILGYPLRFFEQGCDLDNTFVLFIFAGIMVMTMLYLRFHYFVEHGEHLVNNDDGASSQSRASNAPRSSLEEHLLANHDP